MLKTLVIAKLTILFTRKNVFVSSDTVKATPRTQWKTTVVDKRKKLSTVRKNSFITFGQLKNTLSEVGIAVPTIRGSKYRGFIGKPQKTVILFVKKSHCYWE